MKAACLDIDGVLADFMYAVRQTFGEPELPSCYSLEEMYPSQSDKEFERFVEDLDYFELPVVRGAISGVKAIKDMGYEIHYVSQRPMGAFDDTARWLRVHNFPRGKLEFVLDKCDYAHCSQASIFVEDNLSNAVRLARICHCILLDAPYNQGATGDAVRLKGWNAIIRHIRRL